MSNVFLLFFSFLLLFCFSLDSSVVSLFRLLFFAITDFTIFSFFIFYMLEIRYDITRCDKRFLHSNYACLLSLFCLSAHQPFSTFFLGCVTQIDSVTHHVIARSVDSADGWYYGGLCNTNFTSLPPGRCCARSLYLGWLGVSGDELDRPNDGVYDDGSMNTELWCCAGA